jgi:hypothetical protein
MNNKLFGQIQQANAEIENEEAWALPNPSPPAGSSRGSPRNPA